MNLSATDQFRMEKLNFDHPVRPMAFRGKPRTAPRSVFSSSFQTTNGLRRGFYEAPAEVGKITRCQMSPADSGIAEGRVNTPAHGMEVEPGMARFVVGKQHSRQTLFRITRCRDFSSWLGHTALPLVSSLGTATHRLPRPEWITFKPDSKRMSTVSELGDPLRIRIDMKKLWKLVGGGPGRRKWPKRSNRLVPPRPLTRKSQGDFIRSGGSARVRTNSLSDLSLDFPLIIVPLEPV